MSHSTEIKLQFIELRAQEKTLEEISSALDVCKRTLVHWNREFADDIAELREVEREALRRKLFGTTHDWMKGELDHYKRLDAEFARREFRYSPTESVFRMRAESRKTIEKFLFAETPLDHPRRAGGRVVAPSTTAGRDGSPSCPSNGSALGNDASAASAPVPKPPQSQIDIPSSTFDIPRSADPSISRPFPHREQGGAEQSKIDIPNPKRLPSLNPQLTVPVRNDLNLRMTLPAPL